MPIGDNYLVKAIKAKVEGRKEAHIANITAFTKNQTAVGEHIDFIGPLEEELKGLAESLDILAAIEHIS